MKLFGLLDELLNELGREEALRRAYGVSPIFYIFSRIRLHTLVG